MPSSNTYGINSGFGTLWLWARQVSRMPIPSRAWKARQRVKIGELRQALLDAGFVYLDQQAGALGLTRSTTWSVLKGAHKATGLTASVIRRMLSSPTLPPDARPLLIILVVVLVLGALGYFGRGRWF